ncbi:MAG: hypothetical protein EVJ48_03035 [Candidatus Acidulodesulfobacterium acidiphilum]|uniref:Disulphide bond isomerase DsbC/G N-terminal domain-containing protein n=1 Tax=Candidatus Acidulodesulfobacterium acidiphilum TaxID=2597224 RepID=A0A520XFE0_9DELT|nr:MAG: hypothetical protein EVJ48_03035 [Candidatus Acidulodesulfobacterium acidiphilum]
MRFRGLLIILALTAVLFSTGSVFAGQAVNPAVQSILPKIKMSGTFHTPVKGLYGAVISNGQIIYVFPKDKIILLGQMWTAAGKNLTQEARLKMQQSKAEDIEKGVDLKKAIKVGDGPVKVIEFANIDCPFCRVAEKFFSRPEIAKKVTRYIFLIPQPSIHPHSTAMTLYYFTKADGRPLSYRLSLLNKIMVGHIYQTKFGNIAPKIKVSKKAVERLSYNTGLANEYSIFGVPFFIINGKVVDGINIGLILQDLGVKGVNVAKLDHELFGRQP